MIFLRLIIMRFYKKSLRLDIFRDGDSNTLCKDGFGFNEITKFFSIFWLILTTTHNFALAQGQNPNNSTDPTSTVEIGYRITELDSPSELDSPYAVVWRGENEDKVLVDDVCVFSSEGTYRVRVRGSGRGEKFTVKDKKNEIEYQVYWNDEAFLNSNMFQLTENVASRIFNTTETTSSTCNGGQNLTARLQIVFLKEVLMKSNPGSYFGTLTLTIEPI